ncbi:hypothetical protein [Paraburkholderia sacchari]|uniref:Uncharacterized protein n=1 Tax=Paraburkholderia sacchari TaxID=159450 RepID=A0A8T6ZKZ1_9BURK|nr:hypothetical protein [Paraburkholderia sacchari]NLP64944.1 hypothetical protein [Paraburkholderia sacchari]
MSVPAVLLIVRWVAVAKRIVSREQGASSLAPGKFFSAPIRQNIDLVISVHYSVFASRVGVKVSRSR